MPTYLFVYQALPWLQPNDDLYYLGPALIPGLLYHHQQQPIVLKQKDSDVIGGLYVAGLDTIARIDVTMRQALRPIVGEPYLRQTIAACRLGDGQTVTAWVYGSQQPKAMALPHQQAIRHGDYRRYLVERQESKLWLVAYGSNLSTTRLQERIGSPLAIKRGYLPGFRLIFNKKAARGEEVYANICYHDDESGCPAVAYHLEPAQISHLDRYEGAPTHYIRTVLPFQPEDGPPILAYSYIAHPDVLTSPQTPSTEYLAHLQRGYQEHGFTWVD